MIFYRLKKGGGGEERKKLNATREFLYIYLSYGLLKTKKEKQTINNQTKPINKTV